MRRASLALRLDLARRPLLLFAVAVVLPGLALSAFAIASVRQDRRLAEAEARELVDRAADRALDDLARELGRWEAAVEGIPDDGAIDTARLPVFVREALDATGAVLLTVHGSRADAVPPAALLYWPAGLPSPRVLLACATALLELDGGFGRELLAAWLTADAEDHREVAALALGQSRAHESGDCLIAWLESLTWDRDADLGMRALALQRGERARNYLLECVAAGSEGRAHTAVRALSDHLYDPQLRHRLREAAARRGDPALRDEVQRICGTE